MKTLIEEQHLKQSFMCPKVFKSNLCISSLKRDGISPINFFLSLALQKKFNVYYINIDSNNDALYDLFFNSIQQEKKVCHY